MKVQEVGPTQSAEGFVGPVGESLFQGQKESSSLTLFSIPMIPGEVVLVRTFGISM